MIIYDSNIYTQYTKADIIEYLQNNNIEVTQDNIETEYCIMADVEFENLKINLKKQTDNDIICIAELNLWNGRRYGYRLLNNNLSSILDCIQGDYYKIYTDKYNLRCKDVHHDGLNHYVYREIKENVNIDSLTEKIYNQTATTSDITRYTKSLKPIIQEIYGAA